MFSSGFIILKKEKASSGVESTGKSEEQRKKDTINTQIQKDLQKAEQLSEAAKKGLAEGVCPELSHSVCLSICLFPYVCHFLFIYLPLLSVYPSVCYYMFVFCLSLYHYCLSLCLSNCLDVTVCLSLCPSVHFLSIHLSLFLIGLSLYAA